MKLFKATLIGLFFLLTNHTLQACVCVKKGFCESIQDSSTIFEARVVGVRQIDSFKRFVDVEITNFLRKTETITYDTVSLTNGPPTCDGLSSFSHELGSSSVFMISLKSFGVDSTLKYPTIGLILCSTPILAIEEDSISGLFINRGSINDRQTLKYDAFKENIQNSCDLFRLTSTKVFPNPTQTYLSLENILNQDIIFTIYSNTGKVMTRGISNGKDILNIDTNFFPPGIYYLQLRIREEIFYRKIIKN